MAVDNIARGLALGKRVLAQSAVAQTVTGTTAETVLGSVTVPANAMGANGRLVMTGRFTMTGSGGNRTINMKLASTVFATRAAGSGTLNTQLDGDIANRGSTASQTGGGVFFAGATANMASATPGTVDTTANQTFAITAQLAVGTDSITLESWQLILYPHA